MSEKSLCPLGYVAAEVVRSGDKVVLRILGSRHGVRGEMGMTADQAWDLATRLISAAGEITWPAREAERKAASEKLEADALATFYRLTGQEA